MANNLTGDYQAVLQVSVRQLDGILGTMHQRRIDTKASPTFPHSHSFHVGDLPSAIAIEAPRYRDWVVDRLKALPLEAGAPIAERRRLVSGAAPPGLAVMFDEAWKDLDLSVIEPAPGGGVRGWVHVQLGSPRVSFPAGTTSAVMLHVWIRAVFEPDLGSASLPAPIHGQVRVLYTVGPITLPDGRLVLRVRASSDDNQIQFESAATLSAAQVQQIAAQVRVALRTEFVPADVELDPDFAFVEFKGIGGGPTAAVALPLQLAGGPAPAGGLAGVNTHFLGASEFAIAVSKEYVQTFVDSAAATMKEGLVGQGFLGYEPSVGPVVITWKTGALEISVKVDLKSSTLLPDAWVSLTQSLSVVFQLVPQTVSLVALGDPQLDGSWFLPLWPVRDRVRQARDGALPAASAAVSTALKGGLDKLTRGLHEFDPSGSVRLTSVDVTPDGLVVRGAIGTGGRLAPVVHSVPIQNGQAFSAFQSWIPGGRIERFEWTWVEGEVWTSDIESDSRNDEYVCPRPAGLGEANRVCLRIHGSVTESSGHVTENVVAGEICTPSWYPPILTVPPWWIEAIVPIWLPRWPELVLNEQIAGHINVLGETRPEGSLTPNTLVHFAGRALDRPLDELGRALGRMRRQGMSLLLVLVLPRGSFDLTGRELEARLGSLGERFAGRLVLTEDVTGGWQKTFAAPEGESTHLVDARGAFAWRQEGRIDGERLARALDEHGLDAPRARHVPVRLSIQPGEVPPETRLVDDRGTVSALRRMRGRRVLLAFWQSWSAPSLRELERLQALHGQDRALLIFGINGGEDRTVLDEVRRRHGLTLPLVPDPDRALAGRYGVRCWPTTVSINQEGFVDHIQIGLADEPRRDRPAGLA
jgi:peroxiredoxin